MAAAQRSRVLAWLPRAVPPPLRQQLVQLGTGGLPRVSQLRIPRRGGQLLLPSSWLAAVMACLPLLSWVAGLGGCVPGRRGRRWSHAGPLRGARGGICAARRRWAGFRRLRPRRAGRAGLRLRARAELRRHGPGDLGRSGPGGGAGLRGPQHVRHGARGGQLGGHGGNGAMLGPMPMPNRGSLGSQCPIPNGAL